jgi:uncharacterized protein (TIGR02453 family)
MSKRKIYDFLSDLRENNSKDWMDENRERYHEAKDIWLESVAIYLDRLKQYDPEIAALKPKQCIMRINNNNVFHPNKPTYKDSFGFDPYKGRGRVSFYLHLSPSGSFIAGGLYHPSSNQLKKMRAAIDYDGQELLDIVNNKQFNDFFGGFAETEDALKTSPQGYNQDHEHIELLRLKNYVIVREVTQKEVLADDFVDTLELAYKLMQPFNEYLRRGVEFEE